MPDPHASESAPDYTIVLPFSPVSFQGSRPAVIRLREAVRAAASAPGRLLTGEVGVEVEWLLNERKRWESPYVLGTPDIDNVLKPLIDGLCGPAGLLIDDCQVQAVSCHWIDWERDPDQQITIRVRPNMIDDWLSHKPLVWIDMGDGLCWPISSSLDIDAQLTFVGLFEQALDRRDQLLKAGISHADAQFAMPIQRRFHRARLLAHGFDVQPVQAYKDYLTASSGG